MNPDTYNATTTDIMGLGLHIGFWGWTGIVVLVIIFLGFLAWENSRR